MAAIRSIFFLTLLLLSAFITLVCAWLTGVNAAFLDRFPWSMMGFAALPSFVLSVAVYGAANWLLNEAAAHKIKRKGRKWLKLFGLPLMLVIWLIIIPVAIRANHWSAPGSSTRLVVLGLDGASWDVISPRIEDNTLPNIAKLYRQSAHATLQSLEVMRSPALWTTIATGRLPENHGVTGFFSTRRELKTPRVWDLAKANQLSTGLYGWLVTDPYQDPFRFVIPGWLARSTAAMPPMYRGAQEIRLEQGSHGQPFRPWRSIWRCIHAGAQLSTVERLAWFYWQDFLGLTEEQRLAKHQLAQAALHTDLFLHALKQQQPQVAAFVLYGTDKLAHRFWHYFKPDEFEATEALPSDPFLSRVIPRYYQQADRAVGRIMAALPEDCTVLLLSDHGMKADTALPQRFFLNHSRLLRWLDAETLAHYSQLPGETRLEPQTNDELEWQMLLQNLKAIQWPGGDPVFRVQRHEDRSLSLRANFALSWHEASPVLNHDTVQHGEKKLPVDQLFELRTFSANHKREGIVLMKGPAIQPGAMPQQTQLVDIAPTLLYLLNLPISRELPGDILFAALHPAYRQQHEPRYTESYPELNQGDPPSKQPIEALYERLKSVGYVK